MSDSVFESMKKSFTKILFDLQPFVPTCCLLSNRRMGGGGELEEDIVRACLGLAEILVVNITVNRLDS